MGRGRKRVGRGDLIRVIGVRQLKSTVAEIQLGMGDSVVGTVHSVDERGAEHRHIEVDRGSSAVDAQERGQAGVALGDRFDSHVRQLGVRAPAQD